MQTLVIATPDNFDWTISRASQTIRLGYYHGATRAGLEAQFVEYRNLANALSTKPIVWLTYDDYRFLDQRTLTALRDCPHVVQVNTWFDGMEELHRQYNAPSPAIPESLRRRVLDSEPDFVWASAPDAYLEHYDGWRKAGMKVVSLPWACDTERYDWMYALPQFTDVKMAFVGGYRPYKELQYAARLWPYEDILSIWGYSDWPRCYRGYMPNDDEKFLYGQADICPTISEPQFVVTGDTVERPFKIMGSGGVTILDLPCYRELFTEGEVLIAEIQDGYHRTVSELLSNNTMRAEYRHRGYLAVMERHTYKHRVQKLVSELTRC